MPRMVGLIIALLVLAVAGGVAFYMIHSDANAGLIAMDQLPAGYLDIAKQQLPQVKFDKVWRLANGNYEIRGKDGKGKVHEVELDAKGAIVEVD